MKKVAKFKKGDLVRVKNNLKNIRHFVGGYNENMKDYEGEVYEIREIIDDNDFYENVGYRLKDDKNCFTWDERAFEYANELTLDQLQFGDIITLRNEDRYVYADQHIFGEDYCSDCDGDNIDEYNDDLTYDEEDMEEYDIIKVERNGKVIFVRNTKAVEMTVAEISEKLGYEVKIVKEK